MPNTVKTVEGENILSEDFKMGAYSIIVLENMPNNDILKLEDNIKNSIPSVQMCISLADIVGDTFPL